MAGAQHFRCFVLRAGLFISLLPALWMLFAGLAEAQSSFTAGFQTLGLSKPERHLRLDVAIWYPSRRAPTDQQYDDWLFRAAYNAKPLPGKHPLIVLSHDSGGSRFSLNMLASALAQQGFIAVAPMHHGDNINDMRLLFTADQVLHRADEIRILLDALLTHADFEACIDPERIGVAGVGVGATTALLLAGGTFDGEGWKKHCTRASASDPYCIPRVAKSMERMAVSPILSSDVSDPRIRAAALVAPAYGMFFTPQSLAQATLPTLVLRADLDAINLSPHHAEAIVAALPRNPEYSVLTHSDNAALMSPCSKNLAQSLPELCVPGSSVDRRVTQQQMAERIIQFMLNHLQPTSDAVLPLQGMVMNK